MPPPAQARLRAKPSGSGAHFLYRERRRNWGRILRAPHRNLYSLQIRPAPDNDTFCDDPTLRTITYPGEDALSRVNVILIEASKQAA